MATFADAIGNMGDDEPQIETLADAIEMMLVLAEELADNGEHEEAIKLADQAAGMAFQAGDVVHAVKASCETHRYNAHGKPLELFWYNYREFCDVVRNKWLQGRSETEVKWVNTLLAELPTFGENLAKDASEAPKD